MHEVCLQLISRERSGEGGCFVKTTLYLVVKEQQSAVLSVSQHQNYEFELGAVGVMSGGV